MYVKKKVKPCIAESLLPFFFPLCKSSRQCAPIAVQRLKQGNFQLVGFLCFSEGARVNKKKSTIFINH